jgi:hypothetical protein
VCASSASCVDFLSSLPLFLSPTHDGFSIFIHNACGKTEKFKLLLGGEEEEAENCCEKLSREEKIPEVVFHGKTFDFVSGGGLRGIARMMKD